MYLAEEHTMTRNAIRDFAESEVKPVARELDEKEEFSIDLTMKMGEMGLFGMTLPEKYGGQGMDYLSYIIAVEEISRIDGSQGSTVAAHNSLGIGPLYNFGNEEQKQKYLPGLTTGRELWSFGLTEPNAGSDSRGTQTKAHLENGNWYISGSKIFITNGATELTKGATVQAITGENENGKKEYSIIIVEQDAPGFTQEAMHGKFCWRASNTSSLYFDNVKVPESNLVGERGKGSRYMLATLDAGRLAIAAMGLGCAQGAYELALQYAKERHQFGQAIGKFQAISFKLADMATKIEHARQTLYHACWLKDNGKPYSKEAAMSKLFCSEIAKEVSDAAVQVHGGYGLIKEYDVERFYRDQRILQIGEGTSEIQHMVIARHIGL